MALTDLEESRIGRWVLLLPAAVISSLAAYFAVRIILMLQAILTGWGDGLLFYLVLNLVSHGVLGYLFVAVGVAIAPTQRAIVSIVLFSLVAIVFAPFTILLLMQAEGIYEYLEMGAVFSAVAGGGYSLYLYMMERETLFWG